MPCGGLGQYVGGGVHMYDDRSTGEPAASLSPSDRVIESAD